MAQHSRPPFERMLWLHARIREDSYLKASDGGRAFEVSDRIVCRDIRFMRDRFGTPESFDADAYLAESFGAARGSSSVDISIRFDAYQARWIRERESRPTQRVQELNNGGLALSFRITARDEVRRWILQYASHAEALAPPELRLAIAEEGSEPRKPLHFTG